MVARRATGGPSHRVVSMGWPTHVGVSWCHTAADAAVTHHMDDDHAAHSRAEINAQGIWGGEYHSVDQ